MTINFILKKILRRELYIDIFNNNTHAHMDAYIITCVNKYWELRMIFNFNFCNERVKERVIKKEQVSYFVSSLVRLAGREN